jgi:hypothetical protein
LRRYAPFVRTLPLAVLLLSCASAPEGEPVIPAGSGTSSVSALPPSATATPVDPTLPAWEWEGKSGPAPAVDVTVPAGSGTCSLVFAPDGSSTVGCKLSGAGFQRGSPPLEENGALVFSHDTLYVVGFHSISSGAKVHAYDVRGRHLWELALRGCGPVAHSKYYNAVRARLEGKHLVVFGNEANCKYVELVGLAKGETLKHRIESR